MDTREIDPRQRTLAPRFLVEAEAHWMNDKINAVVSVDLPLTTSEIAECLATAADRHNSMF